MSLKAVGYVRVSTEEQARNGYSLGNQRDRIKEFAHARGLELVGFYEDEGFSARSMKRPGIQRLIRDATDLGFDVVVAYDHDRVARKVLDAESLIEWVLTTIGCCGPIATMTDDELRGRYAAFSPGRAIVHDILWSAGGKSLQYSICRSRIAEELVKRGYTWDGHSWIKPKKRERP